MWQVLRTVLSYAFHMHEHEAPHRLAQQCRSACNPLAESKRSPRDSQDGANVVLPGKALRARLPAVLYVNTAQDAGYLRQSLHVKGEALRPLVHPHEALHNACMHCAHHRRGSGPWMCNMASSYPGCKRSGASTERACEPVGVGASSPQVLIMYNDRSSIK